MDQRFQGVVVFVVTLLTAMVFQYGFQVYFQAPAQPVYEEYLPSNLPSVDSAGKTNSEYTIRNNNYTEAVNTVNQQTQVYDRNRFMAEAAVLVIMFLVGWLLVKRRPLLASGLVTGVVLGELFLRGVFNFDYSSIFSQGGGVSEASQLAFAHLTLTIKLVTVLVVLVIVGLIDWYKVEPDSVKK